MACFACTSSADKKEKENLAIAQKYMKAVETKNVAAMDSLLADNYIGYGPSVGDSTNKEAGNLTTGKIMRKTCMNQSNIPGYKEYSCNC